MSGTTSMTITITEDAASDGCVAVNYDFETAQELPSTGGRLPGRYRY